MAQYVIHDPDEYLQCPYDKTHKKLAKGFQIHLMKCRKNYSGKDFVTCPFNAKHEMPKPEIRHHLSQCPDRAVIEPELEFISRKQGIKAAPFKGCTDTPVYNDLTIPSSEDWDSEMDPFNNGTALKSNVFGVPRAPQVFSDPLSQQPQVQPRQQPDSSVFAYSVNSGHGRGRGRGRGVVKQTTDGNIPPFTMWDDASMMPVGRGMAMGRCLSGVGGYVRGSTVSQPPGFCVPNIYK